MNAIKENLGYGRARARIVHQREIDGVLVTLSDEEQHNVVTNGGRDFMHTQCYASSGIGANGLNYIDSLGSSAAQTCSLGDVVTLVEAIYNPWRRARRTRVIKRLRGPHG